MIFYCDKKRHLVCEPYSIENLHKMADSLNIKRNWFHSKERNSHYDIPKGRMEDVVKKCTLVSSKEIVKICRDAWVGRKDRFRKAVKKHHQFESDSRLHLLYNISMTTERYKRCIHCNRMEGLQIVKQRRDYGKFCRTKSFLFSSY